MPQTVEAQSLTRTSGSGDLETALLSFSQILHQDLSRNRFAEEREWYEDALFYQRRQWLKWDSSNKRWSLVKQDPDKPRPMPVTNHYARTINAVANQLSSGTPKVNGIPLDDSDKARRGAEFAEQACRAVDRESDFKILKPLLGKHTVLWGVGVTKDFYDSGISNGVVNVPQIEVQTSRELGCHDCGQVGEIPPTPEVSGGDIAAGQLPCPNCGSSNTENWTTNTPVTTEVRQFSKGRICTEVRPIFEIFVPRDCQNPNLAPKIQQRYRKPLQVAKRIWGERAEDLRADQKNDIHEIYLEALRSLVNYNYMHDQTSESVTITETWSNFDELPEELQELLEEAVQAGDLELGDGTEPAGQGDGFNQNPDEQGAGLIDPGSAEQKRAAGVDGTAQAGEGLPDEDAEETAFEAPDGELDPLEQLKQWGIFIIEGGGKILDWGINNLEGKKPFTFWLWELDPANVYPKGLGVDLVPLQKRLNRLDSLMELGIMSNAAGKWIWPTTQTTKPPTGSPSDTVEYDPIGDGKIAPEFVQPSPFHQACFQLRMAILADFQTIGMTQGIQQGENPQGVTAFRGLAYLGAKADEQISTQRFLWETAAGLRYEKCLILAKRNWTEERKVKVAGFNGRYGMESLWGQDLDAQFVVEIQPDSTRPMSMTDKQQAFTMLLEGGMVDPTDPATREFIIDLANLNGVNLVSHLQYMKADRDLQSVIQGNIPPLNPYIDLNVFLKVFSSYTLTEEFEALPQDGQQRVLMATQMISQQQQAQMAQQMAAAAMMGPPGAPGQPPGAKLAGAMKDKGKKQPTGLNAVPGQSSTPEQAGQEAMSEGNSMAAAMP
jgi:hypothetical protein